MDADRSSLARYFGQLARADTGRVREIVEFRRLLEPEIAALAARNAEPRDVERIAAIVAGQERAVAEGRDDPADDMHFHLALARATKNEVLREIVAVLHDLLAESRAAPLRSPERTRASLAAHGRIVEALRRRDPEAGRAAMADHLAQVVRTLDPAD